MKKILIIEDDQIVANVYRNKLAVEGYGVETAPKPKVEISYSFAEAHANAHLDNLPIQARL